MKLKFPNGVAAGNPKPKNDNATSIPIFEANANVALTIIIEEIFGNISLNIILKLLVPIVFEALT